MTFEEKKDEFFRDIYGTMINLVDEAGQESEHYSDKVIIPDDDFMFNLDVGHPSGSYVIEVTGTELISNYGHKYNFDVLELEVLCELLDHLVEKYSN